jgi:hypothetical protein
MIKINEIKKYFSLFLLTTAVGLFTMACTEPGDEPDPDGFTITIHDGDMVWWKNANTPNAAPDTVSLKSGDIMYENDVIVIISADPVEGKEFDYWDISPSTYANSFMAGFNKYDDVAAFIMPASDVIIRAKYKDAEGELEDGYAIFIVGGTMEWWEDPSDPNATSPLSNGQLLYESDIVIVLSATPPTGKVFDKWTVSPSSAASRFNDVNDPRTTFSMPASDVDITATFRDVSANVKFTWELDEQAAIQNISASETDVAYWYENDYEEAFLADGTELPIYFGSPDLPNNIYSKTIGTTTNKGKYFPLEEGDYTAVCSIEDEDFPDQFWDIVANYTIVTGDTADTYFEVFFDVGGFFSELTSEYWQFFVREDANVPDYLTKARTSKLAQKIGTKKFSKAGSTVEVTYYLLHRTKKS